MRDASILLLLLFTVVATVDGFYFHLFKYRLHARPASRLEHGLHTLNAILFPISLAPLYLARSTGLFLWMAGIALAITLLIESGDVFIERESRASLGGLTSTEYWMHFMMSGLRWSSAVLILASTPTSAWIEDASWSWTLPSWSNPLGFLTWGIALTGVPVALIHVMLGWQGHPRRAVEQLLFLTRPAPT